MKLVTPSVQVAWHWVLRHVFFSKSNALKMFAFWFHDNDSLVRGEDLFLSLTLFMRLRCV
jgi:hypothetical protein